MKNLFVILLLLFALTAYTANPTVTLTSQDKSGIWSYSFSFTTSATGVSDTAIIAPAVGFFTVDEWVQFDPVFYFTSDETSADSVSFATDWQCKGYVGDDWHTVVTATNSVTLQEVYVLTQNTYGRWPLHRLLIRDLTDSVSIQTVSGGIMFKKGGDTW